MSELKSQHDARRTFATDLYNLGMNINSIRVMMGHESLSQTEAYIQSSMSIEDEILLEDL